MRVMDNSPIDVPAVGRLVKETYAVGQLADCCLYVLSSNASSMVEKAKEVFDGLMKSMGADKLLNKYDFEVLDKLPVLDNHAILSKAIEDEKCQFLMSLFTPSKVEKQYLLLNTGEEKLYSDIAMVLYASERISKHSVSELLRQYALELPEAFSYEVNEAIKSEKFWKNYLVSVATDMFQPTFGMQATMPNIKEVLKIDGIITYKKKKEMMNRMIENIYKIRKHNDEKAEAELNYVLRSLDVESLKAILLKMSKKQLDTFYKTANPLIRAEESTMSLEIKYIGKLDPVQKTNGRYRLFLQKDYDQIQVHFARRDTFILYLIYLIDKHERNDVDTINIEDYEQQFKDLYGEVYVPEEAAAMYNAMVKCHDKDGNPQQPQIKHCYADIRSALIDGCEKLRELSSPFTLMDAQDHLKVLKDRITIPQNLIDLMKVRN